ncbi:3-oxoacyl-[acyl-carrier-protein] reductase FabG isoform X1 [Hydra vulgaris]|uniref:3-oxoacyl-[acyl-carrier-protein] reductase FabG isoform X1 n=1 Tax=Hydra vulgaris TaxID=6087 RepID=UPI0002B4AF03|nr:3-oxoacyl-[acyl-carrier-protein] reductase FabG [Hydra vulgaris]
MTTRLDNKVALITGASSGIGAKTAILFSKLGSKLSLCGRNVQNLEAVAKQCEEVSPEGLKPFLVVVNDLTNEEDTKRLLNETMEHYKTLDILVNNAGILLTGSVQDLSMEKYDLQTNVNVRAVYHLTKICIPYLIASKGNIVFVSSVTGLRSFPNVAAYCMSKSAIDHFCRCLALELAPQQVRVNCVNPGVIKTECHLRYSMDEEKYKEFLKHAKETHALGRYGEAEEVANAIAFLASDGASFITGATLPVDGGRSVMCPR